MHQCRPGAKPHPKSELQCSDFLTASVTGLNRRSIRLRDNGAAMRAKT
jgi:hypothetical protein